MSTVIAPTSPNNREVVGSQIQFKIQAASLSNLWWNLSHRVSTVLDHSVGPHALTKVLQHEYEFCTHPNSLDAEAFPQEWLDPLI
jgi:hypothetical protein